MSALSKLGGSSKMILGGWLGRIPTVSTVRHGGHGHVFRRRQGQMVWNKAKDNWHFYIVGVGLIPCGLILFFTHVFYGPCVLTEYPTEGPPPHYWQFERTPLKQFYAWLLGETDIKYTESYLSLFARLEVKNIWRAYENRVKHLQGERLDYKGYFYHPLTNQWLEFSKKRAENSIHYIHHHGRMHTTKVM